MAQQTINVGTAPNDGTGTPLRTAFQYTNSNFSELYTALGGGSGLPGTSGQVLFNNGTNIAGDAGLVYNSTTDALTIGGNVQAASATITGNLTVNGSYISCGNNSYIRTDAANLFSIQTGSGGFRIMNAGNSALFYGIDSASTSTWYDGAGGTRMTLNSTGLGVGVVPSTGKFEVGIGAGTTTPLFRFYGNSGSWNGQFNFDASGNLQAYSYNGTKFTDFVWPYGNVGIGVTPSAWWSSTKALQFGLGGSISGRTDTGARSYFASNAFLNSSPAWTYVTTNFATRYEQNDGTHQWHTAPSGTAGNAITFTQAMTLDASGNLLVGTTTSAGKFTLTQSANADSVSLTGNSGNFLRLYGWSVDNTWNANATAIFVGKQTSTSRSINAGGTVNASGADYAEYMTKGSDFVLSKGDIAGIDANGKLTNVFADAVSFVVKSTDPSYVGNDKWGVNLEGDALEAARQLVDRIAFAGQVPVNVTGAKAGDYIVPVVDGTGIKGIAVSNPTFEQYQLAVGKVIAIDADGRARIIVKVA